MGRSLTAVWVCGCLLLATGCSTTRFSVVDATSNSPLEVVHVDGYRFRPFQQIPSDFAWREVNVASTDRSGTASTVQPVSLMPGENEFRYVFTKAGYRPAEVLVYNDRTIVASPADDAGWEPVENDPRHLVGRIPTRNFQTLSGKGDILVRLYPIQPDPAPAADSNTTPEPTADLK